MKTTLDRALALARRGLPVFPCAAGKNPTCPHGFKDATRDEAAIRQLWRDYPGVLIGVPTGADTGLFVVDVDSAKHASAEEWLERQAPYLPDTRHHRTKSGGLHIFFRHRQGMKCTCSRLAHGVDTRGDGGYVLWWPAAIAGDHRFAELAEIPDWIVAALEPPKQVYVEQRPMTPQAAKGKIAGIVGAMAAAREGERNALTYWGACRLAELVKQFVLSQQDAFDLAIEAARQAGLTHKEAAASVGSAFRSLMA